jgi:peroxiredoxin
MKNKTAAIAALTMIVLTAAGTAACAAPKPEIQEAAAPDFSIADLQGNTLTLSGYEGKVLFINFWATWCPPCRKEIPDFIEATRELKGEGLEILGISVDQMPAEALLEWVRKTGINYPIALATPEIVRAYEPGEYIPATIVVDRKGVIRYRQSELMDKDTLVKLFRKWGQT